METINFIASLHKISVDREGEAQITLTVPHSDRDAVMSLGRLMKVALRVTVEVVRND